MIEKYLTSTTNNDGSITKIKISDYTSHSLETIDVNGKFIYSILDPDSVADKYLLRIL